MMLIIDFVSADLKTAEKIAEETGHPREGSICQFRRRMPVVPGTPVYVVERCYCGSAYAARCRMRGGITDNRNKAVAVLPMPETRKNAYSIRCKKIYERPFDPCRHLSSWKKRVFPTFEEAKEKAYEGNT